MNYPTHPPTVHPESVHPELPEAPPIPHNPIDVAPYPAGLALELALNKDMPLADVLTAYNITPLQFKAILRNPEFRQELVGYREQLKVEGWSFKQKAKAQAEEYLRNVWAMVHDPHTPAAVKADLIKQTVRWARLDAPDAPANTTNNFNMAVGSGLGVTPDMLDQLRNMPDTELEARVMQVIVRKTKAQEPDTFDVEVERLVGNAD